VRQRPGSGACGAIVGADFPELSCGCSTDNGRSGIGDGVSIGITGTGVAKPRRVTDAPQLHERPRQSWVEAEPAVLRREQAAMRDRGPDMI
jgi:hypothetical protein